MRNSISLAAIAAVVGSSALAKAFTELDAWENTPDRGKDPERDVSVIKAALEKRERKNQKRLRNV